MRFTLLFSLIVGGSAVIGLMSSPQAAAQTITGSFTADNAYQVWIGGPTSVTTKIAQDINTTAKQIKNGEQFEFEYVPACHIYVVAWSDAKNFQGLIGSFTGQITLNTGDPAIEVLASGIPYDSDAAPPTFPSIKQVNSALKSGTFVAPAVGAGPNGPPWYFNPLAVPGLDPQSQWIWHDSGNGNPNAPQYPFAPGVDHDEFLVFRVPCGGLVPEPPVPGCCPPWGESRLENMMEYEGTGGIADPYTLKFEPTSQFNKQMAGYVNYLSTLNPAVESVHLRFGLHDHGSGPTPVSDSNSSQVGGVEFAGWNPSGGPINPVNFFPASQMQVGTWYRVSTWTYLNDKLNEDGAFFSHDCAANRIYVRVQVEKAGSATLEVKRAPDGPTTRRGVREVPPPKLPTRSRTRR